jgi:hypothetical protein
VVQTRVPGLFEKWMEVERAPGRSMSDILAELNAAAGTHYKHNWPSVVASRNFELERCPVAVRRYMLAKVLPKELMELGLKVDELDLGKLIQSLT